MRVSHIRLALSREQRVRKALIEQLEANASTLEVVDLSGGCDGGTIRIVVESPKFIGKTVVAQHRLVNEVIADEMKTLHAAVIETRKPTATQRKD